MTQSMAVAKFGVDDAVRFVGTDALLAIRQYNPETLEYQVQQGEDAATLEWVPGIYLEQA
jgi:hypothetical protein